MARAHAWEQLPSRTQLLLVVPRALADEEEEGMDVQNKHSPIMLAWVEAKIFTFPYRCFGEVFWLLSKESRRMGGPGQD